MDNFDLKKYLVKNKATNQSRLNEEFKRMQTLAGIITESKYEKLTENKASDLINDGVVLYVSDDSKLAPGFIKPKGIGFIVYNVAIKDISTLSKKPEVIQLFNDNYGIIDINYITSFFTNPENWKTITNEDELNKVEDEAKENVRVAKNNAWNEYLTPIKNEIEEVILELQVSEEMEMQLQLLREIFKSKCEFLEYVASGQFNEDCE